MLDKIITIVSVCTALLSVAATIAVAIYQTNRTQKLEKEKTRLETYSLFIAYCQKKCAGASTKEDDFELMKIHAKLCLITDHELNQRTEKLYDSLFKNPSSDETIMLINEEARQMWLRLQIFNRRFGQRFPHY